MIQAVPEAIITDNDKTLYRQVYRQTDRQTATDRHNAHTRGATPRLMQRSLSEYLVPNPIELPQHASLVPIKADQPS